MNEGGELMEQYSGLAEIYDRTIDMDYDKWADFVKSYFESKGSGIRGKRLLELGCGTGNMTLRLKSLGADVTAIDISQEMLTVAEEKSWSKKIKLSYLNQDMVNFNIQRKFSIAASFCDGYNYILEKENLKESFKRVFNHLDKGGYFIFDISTPYKLKNKVGNNTFTLNEEDISYIWDNYLEDDTIEMYLTFFVKQDKLYRRLEEHHIQRIYEIDFIEKSLEEAGFKNIEIYDDYSLQPANMESLRATFIAMKEE
jgi:ubiquinone/menaquinone biosynthesis C-methylase UbiE